jgi:hypothetical protein
LNGVQPAKEKTTSADDRASIVSGHPAPRQASARILAACHRAAAPGAAGLSRQLATAGELPKFSRRSGVTPGTNDF